MAASEDEAVAAAKRISGPVALKVQSPDILHKTEAGAVLLNLSGDEAVRDGYRTVTARGPKRRIPARISRASWCRRWRGAGSR